MRVPCHGLDSAAFSGSGFVHAQRPTAEVFAIEVADRRFGLSLIGHLDKTEPSGPSRFSVK